MKIVFMGTPLFALPSLEALIENHEVVAVFTQPDKPKGRGNKLVAPPIKQKAMECGIDCYQPSTLKDEQTISLLKSFNADVFVVVAYGRILPETVLNIARYGSINVHGSLLPKLRGAAPIQRSIINGDKKTGVTTMFMAKGLDTGDMLLKEEMDILDSDTYESLSDRMSKIGAKLLVKTLDELQKGELTPIKQDDTLATHAAMIDAQTEHINWEMSAEEIVNIIRGLNPNPVAYSMYDEKKMKIWFAEAFENNSDAKCGEIILLHKKGIVVKANENAVLLTKIQAPGKKQMDAGDYLRGNSVKLGELFY